MDNSTCQIVSDSSYRELISKLTGVKTEDGESYLQRNNGFDHILSNGLFVGIPNGMLIKALFRFQSICLTVSAS